MSLIDAIFLTLVNTAICIALPKIISSVFSFKSKPKTLSQATTIAFNKAN